MGLEGFVSIAENREVFTVDFDRDDMYHTGHPISSTEMENWRHREG